MKEGDALDLTGGDLAFQGETVAKAEGGFVVFVPGLAPGDRARVRITQVRKNYARGAVLSVEAAGPDRVAPPCPVFGTCGGCQWQHVALAAQRDAKARIVRRLLEPLGAADRLLPIEGSGDGYRYRNRLILPVRAARDGALRAGFFRAGTHRLVEVDACAVQHPALMDAARAVLSAAREAHVTGYDELTGQGLLRHLLLRIAAGTGEIGVILVTTGEPWERAADFAAELMQRVPAIAGVARNINPEATNVILGPVTTGLAGRDSLTEVVGGLTLRASLAGFFQANDAMTERMLARIREWTAGETGGVLDLYCGVGLLGLAAGEGTRAWLAGIEEHPGAVADAGMNAAAAGTPGRFRAGPVETVLPHLVAEGLDGVGTVIVDPPRKGLLPAALLAVAALPARRLIYVSCDPLTFARDARELVARGWRLAAVVPLDMFPQTYHIELMGRFER